ncbi:Pectin lyase-like superfamily protein [Quillaja saponaria]|uniref:Pectin lyase-like superfamily protein n=1 Tax=Quillaja saponaria TaxID=32244 RepID=A0AAD7PC17_QUISA|nr:Pectin lyase-like superfamily protein [Quillaja saponaria]
MQSLFTILFVFWVASCCSFRKILTATNTTTFNVIDYGAVGDGLTDDSQAFLKAWKDMCEATQSTPTLEVPLEKTFMLKPLSFNGPCNSPTIHFQLEGNVVAPKNTDAWEGQSKDKWIVFINTDGLIIDGGGQIDGQGSVWWDACKGKLDIALSLHNCSNLQLSGLHHLNSGRNHISLSDCTNTSISSISIVAPEDSPNTDGIDICRSTNILIQDSNIGTGDDCIAMNDGTSYINITGVSCGPGHGISVGSLGEDGAEETVEQVIVHDCSFSGTQNGLRIKTWQGGSGYVRNISYDQITFANTYNPIIIDQFYVDRGRQLYVDEGNQASAVEISNITYRDVNGTSASETAITLNCSMEIGCNDIIMHTINIISSTPGAYINTSCNNAHGKVTSVLPSVSCLDVSGSAEVPSSPPVEVPSVTPLEVPSISPSDENEFYF